MKDMHMQTEQSGMTDTKHTTSGQPELVQKKKILLFYSGVRILGLLV